ncbi:uncharacterized protein isoform X1 [Salmo salar]|uniref:Uncharacterized protein isoform X1 n=3 Tax=Salmo salar TaxID=8030 RepID=A0A1S3QB24_SALSA|nr:uncharacterized protein LOC106590592 isoform X1 [Salmo salar]|eukprot:XP_014037180.1 PREDICTED: uncharacterized protein LOC106590592 isoform X1 [Salmo salar]
MGGFQESLTSKTPSVDSLIKCCRACLSLGWSMSGPKLQHLLGTSVFSLMLLPLVLSCDSNRTMREIVEDYETVISLLLQNLENNITESLKVSHKSCTGEMPECEKDNERQFIYNMMCSHTRLIRLFKLERLKREILCSLGRYCPRKQKSSQGQHTTHQHQRRKKKKPGGETVEEKERTEENRGTTEGGERLDSGKQQGRLRKEISRSTEAMKRRRRQCGLKVFVDSLQVCYMSLAEIHGDLK